MRAIGLRRFGGPDVLEEVQHPDPGAPGHGEVRIAIHAATVNPADFYVRDGRLAEALSQFPAPWIPGIEAAGVVEAIGDTQDQRFAVGDAVMAHVMPLTARGGAYAEHVITLARWTVRAPAGVGHSHAATMPMNGMTALDAVEKAGALPGATIAVVGATGAVGGYAVQLAKALGAQVLADAGPHDEDIVRHLGADVVVPRGSTAAWASAASESDAIDGVVDAVGHAQHLLPLVRPGGRYVFVAAAPSAFEAAQARGHGIAILGVNVTTIPDSARMLEQLRRQAEAGHLTTRVQRVFRPEEAAIAHKLLAAGGTCGRLVLDFSRDPSRAEAST